MNINNQGDSCILCRKKFAPHEIFPTGFGEVRLNFMTFRVAQQAAVGGLLHHDYMEAIAPTSNRYYAQINKFPGWQEIAGGANALFDLKARGRHPFEGIRKLKSHLPDTPTFGFMRSYNGITMSPKPADILRDCVKLHIEAGLDGIRNFHSNNDPRHFNEVAKTTLEMGAHFQALFVYESLERDPTVYNVLEIVDFFSYMREELGAHSFILGDPSGILLPEMAKIITAEVKAAHPDIAFGIQANHTSGISYLSCMAAVSEGANFIDCAPSPLAEGVSLPSGSALFIALEEGGFDLGVDPVTRDQAFQALTEQDRYLDSIVNQLYQKGKPVKKPNANVLRTHIPGAQEQILLDRLIENGLQDKEAEIHELVAEIRIKNGGLPSATPNAEAWVEQALNNFFDCKRKIEPRFRDVLIGKVGITPLEIAPSLQKQALCEQVEDTLKQFVRTNKISADKLKTFSQPGNVVSHLVEYLYILSAPIRIRQRLQIVDNRINRLQRIQQYCHSDQAIHRRTYTYLERTIEKAGKVTQYGQAITTLKAAIQAWLNEKERLQSLIFSNGMSDDEYEMLLNGKPSNFIYKDILANNPNLEILVSDKQTLLDIIKAGCVIPWCDPEHLPNGLIQSTQELVDFAWKEKIILPINQHHFQEYVVLWAMFSDRQQRKIMEDFLRNYPGNTGYWQHPDPEKNKILKQLTIRSNSQPIRLTLTFLLEHFSTRSIREIELDLRKKLYSQEGDTLGGTLRIWESTVGVASPKAPKFLKVGFIAEDQYQGMELGMTICQIMDRPPLSPLQFPLNS
ncbi:MAG: hypothetical protein F6K41_09850 [Symploca sp. SIO3E6]|nr:hypothetical protein [Caldora sp. SIO3E6]